MITITLEEAEQALFNSGEGICVACGSRPDRYVDPDESQRHCRHCEASGVYGVEQAILEGKVLVT